MDIVWDETKRLANLDKHGLDFADVADHFEFERAVYFPARQIRTGRIRRMAVGLMHGMVVVLIQSPLGAEALSLVSLRPAKAKERKRYAER